MLCIVVAADPICRTQSQIWRQPGSKEIPNCRLRKSRSEYNTLSLLHTHLEARSLALLQHPSVVCGFLWSTHVVSDLMMEVYFRAACCCEGPYYYCRTKASKQRVLARFFVIPYIQQYTEAILFFLLFSGKTALVEHINLYELGSLPAEGLRVVAMFPTSKRSCSPGLVWFVTTIHSYFMK